MKKVIKKSNNILGQPYPFTIKKSDKNRRLSAFEMEMVAEANRLISKIGLPK